jgi:hypothetical protein
MRRQRFFWLLAVALLVISGGLYLNSQRNSANVADRGALLPSLAHELDSVSGISVHRAGKNDTVTLTKQQGKWTVAELRDYPADVGKVRKLLVALADAKIIEVKTSNPQNFSLIGVEDPQSANATGAEIAVVTPGARQGVIVGKVSGQGNFARRSGENASYVVEPAISFEAEPRFWIDTRLFDVPADAIQQIDVKLPGAPAYSVHRTAAGAAKFTLDGVPSGRQAADSQMLAPSPTTYSALDVDDVAPSTDVDFATPALATVTLADGAVLAITGTASAGKHWIEVKSNRDSQLNAKAQGRVFEVSGYRYDAIFRPLESLLVPQAAVGPKQLPSKSPAPAPKP